MEVPGDRFPRFDLEGRVCLVTGAARGIGRSIALAVADAGADVALVDRLQAAVGDTYGRWQAAS